MWPISSFSFLFVLTLTIFFFLFILLHLVFLFMFFSTTKQIKWEKERQMVVVTIRAPCWKNIFIWCLILKDMKKKNKNHTLIHTPNFNMIWHYSSYRLEHFFFLILSLLLSFYTLLKDEYGDASIKL